MHKGLSETPSQFRRRMDKVEEHLNSGEWSESPDALLNLSRSYRERARELQVRVGDRIPK